MKRTDRHSRKALRAIIEDNALSVVPPDQRKGGGALLFNSAAVVITLLTLTATGTVTILAGTKLGLLVGVLSMIIGAALGWGTGNVCQVSGTSSTVTARYYGLGIQGSLLASFVFAFMMIGFLAIENVLLYNGTLFMFGWHPTLRNAVMIYGAFTLLWIAVTTFGLGAVQRSSSFFTIVTSILLVVVMALAALKAASLGHTVNSVITYSPKHIRFSTAFAMLAGEAGAIALISADFARYARSKKDVGIMTVGGAILINIVMVAVGALIMQLGGHIVLKYLTDPTNASISASVSGTTIGQKLQVIQDTNVGAYFVIIAGIVGFAVMYSAQIKAQVVNNYSSSLALSNFVARISRRYPGRLVMVVGANFLALVAIATGIVNSISTFLSIIAILTMSLCVLIMTDYYVIRRRRPAIHDQAERYNVAGIVSLLVGTAVGYGLDALDITHLGFLAAMVVTFILYIPLRRLVWRPEVPRLAKDIGASRPTAGLRNG